MLLISYTNQSVACKKGPQSSSPKAFSLNLGPILNFLCIVESGGMQLWVKCNIFVNCLRQHKDKAIGSRMKLMVTIFPYFVEGSLNMNWC